MSLKKKIIAFLGLLFLSAAGIIPIFAIDAYVTVIYRRVDIAFVNKSDAELNTILSETNIDKNYYLIEGYSMKKIRRLVIDEDYDFASKAILVVIDNNLDNMEAVDLYATISSALEKQKEQERLVEEKKKIEMAKFTAEKEKQKVALEKTYNAVQTNSGETVYVKSKEEKFSSTWWKLAFGMFDGTFINDAGHSYKSFRYGINSDFSYEYTFDKIMVGFDVGAEAVILPFSGDDNTILSDFEFVPKIGFPDISKKLQLRTGFAGYLRMGGDEVNPTPVYYALTAPLYYYYLKQNEGGTSLQGNFFSPLVGIGFDHLNLGKVTFNGHADYLFGHFAYNGLSFAMKSALNVAIPIAEMEKFKVSFNFGVKDTLFLRDSGVENRASLVLALGAENVIK